MKRTLTVLALLALGCSCSDGAPASSSASALTGPTGWNVHVIADFRLGSDGVVYHPNIDGNGMSALFGAWEADGRISAHVHPTQLQDLTWPSAYFGSLPNAEGIQVADLDGDGLVDAVGAQQVPGAVRLFFAPTGSLADGWPIVTLPQTGDHRWLDTTLFDVDGDSDPDVLGRPATRDVMLWIHPGSSSARNSSAWAAPTSIITSRWVMSLDPVDVDGDADLDLIVSQRRELTSPVAPAGLFWAENGASWARHDLITGAGGGMIACVGDLDGDADVDVVWPSELPAALRWFEATGGAFVEHAIALPFTVPSDAHAKGCAIGDIDGDGDADIVLTSYKISPDLWVLENDGAESFAWIPILPTSWASKLDAPLLLDVDSDGDLDIVGSEENQSRGVFWSENP